MPEWLNEVALADSDLSFQITTIRLAIAAVMGLVVAAVCYASQRRPAAEVFPFLVTMCLLTILVAMTTLVIGNSVARAFGLVGALSIVRFRTVVDDTRDTAFVIFAVVVGMSVGAGHLDVGLIGTAIVSALALSLHAFGQRLRPVTGDAILEVRLGSGHDPEKLLADVFARHLASSRLTSVTTARQGVALDLFYMIRLQRPDAPLPLVQELIRLEGVQNAELKLPPGS